jgi:hypothetical protein
MAPESEQLTEEEIMRFNYFESADEIPAALQDLADQTELFKQRLHKVLRLLVHSEYTAIENGIAGQARTAARRLIYDLSHNGNRTETLSIARTSLPLLRRIRDGLEEYGSLLDPYIDNLQRRVSGQVCASLEEVEGHVEDRERLMAATSRRSLIKQSGSTPKLREKMEGIG